MVLLDRERELAFIDAALAAAEAGRGSLLAIAGEPGIGKSALLDAARGLAEARGMASACGRGEGDGGRPAFALLGEIVAALEDPATGEGLAASVTSADAPPPELSVARGFTRLVEAASRERPLLLVADDLHWADLPSLRSLLHLARRLAELNVALCVATRPASDGAPLPPPLDALRLGAGERLLEPQPLGGDACAALVESSPGRGGGFRLQRRLPRGERRQPAAVAGAPARPRRGAGRTARRAGGGDPGGGRRRGRAHGPPPPRAAAGGGAAPGLRRGRARRGAAARRGRRDRRAGRGPRGGRRGAARC